MDQMTELLKEPFAIGLFIGLALSLTVAFSSWRKRRGLRRIKDEEIQRLKKENQRLKEIFVTKEEIQDQGKQSLTQKIEDLKEQNENLRVSLKTFMNEPDKAELRDFHIYYKAIRKMNKRAPGFAAAWESCLEEAEADIEEARKGLIPWIRQKLNPPQLIPKETVESQDNTERKLINQNDGTEKDN